MRQRWARFATGIAVTAAVLGGTLVAAAPAQAQAFGGNELVTWAIPNAPAEGLSTITFPMTVASTTVHHEGTYFAMQFGFTGVSDVGYTGLQPRPDLDGHERLHAAFSSFVPGTISGDPNCSDGADGGAGVSCAADFDGVYGDPYDVVVTQTGVATWSGTAVDTVTGVATHVGSYTLPRGSGLLASSQVGFVEYYDVPPKADGTADCDTLPDYDVTFGAPTSNELTGTTTWDSEYGDCLGSGGLTVQPVGDGVRLTRGSVSDTPTLTTAVAPAQVSAGQIATVTYTITNTADGAEKSGIAFDETLPVGLAVAGPPGGTCEAVVTAPTGSTQVRVTDGHLAAGSDPCTVTVPISGRAGSYGLGPDAASLARLRLAGQAPRLDVTAVPGDAPLYANLTPPTIAGAARVGKPLTASPGTWTISTGQTFAYQWAADGRAIAGATGPRFTPQPAQKGKSLTVLVTSYWPGHAAVSATSAPTATVRPARKPVARTRPRINGAARVGHTLIASPGRWARAQGARYTYRWMAGSRFLGVGVRLEVGPETIGSRIRVRVVCHVPGAPRATAYSAPTAKVVGR